MDLLYRPTLDLGAMMLDQLHDPSRRKLILTICDALRAGVLSTERATELLWKTWEKEYPGRTLPSGTSSLGS